MEAAWAENCKALKLMVVGRHPIHPCISPLLALAYLFGDETSTCYAYVHNMHK